MKRICMVLLLTALMLAATACGNSSVTSTVSSSNVDKEIENTINSTEVALGSEGISINLPKEFSVGGLDLSDYPDITTTFSNETGTIAILAIKEPKSEIDVNSVYDYL